MQGTLENRKNKSESEQPDNQVASEQSCTYCVLLLLLS